MERLTYSLDTNVILVISLCLLSACGSEQPSPQPIATYSASISDDYSLAFVTRRDGNLEIYSMSVDGTQQTNLTNNSAVDRFPAYSPNGQLIVFESSRDGNQEIYIMNADGSQQRNLTNNSADDTSPAWSPNGDHIAFVSYRDGNYEIYVMNVDGTNQHNLSLYDGADTLPSWSPDGEYVAFLSNRDVRFRPYMMQTDGLGQNQLGESFAELTTLSWVSSNLVAFVSGGTDLEAEIYAVDISTQQENIFIGDITFDGFFSISPDQQYIAFASERTSDSEIYVMDISTRQEYVLTNNEADDYYPVFAP